MLRRTVYGLRGADNGFLICPASLWLSKAKDEPVSLAAKLRIENDLAVIVVHVAEDIAFAVKHKTCDFKFRNNDARIDTM